MVNNQKYSGSTFNSYKGNEGDGICVEYLATNPAKNIYCHDKPKEDIIEDGFIPAIQTVGILFFGGPLLLLGYILFGNKKVIVEITSRK